MSPEFICCWSLSYPRPSWYHCLVRKSSVQKIELLLIRGVARTSPMLGYSKGILRLYEILRKVQKHLGGLGHALSAYAVSVRDSNSVDIHSDTVSFDFKTV